MTISLAIVIKENLDKGLTANISAVLATSFVTKRPDIIGSDIVAHDLFYNGITKIPIIILGDKNSHINQIISNACKYNIDYILYDKIAASCHDYDEYIRLVKDQNPEKREILGIGLIGDKQLIKKLTGNLPLLKN